MRQLFAGAAAIAVAALSQPVLAANSFNIDYYLIAGTYNGAGSGDPDFNTIGCCTTTYYNEVQSSLGPSGLPVYNPGYGGPTIHDVNANGEITWWSPGQNSNVTHVGSGTITTPFANYSFYPSAFNGGYNDDSHGFMGAVISGVFNLATPEAVTFSFGADDDAFLAVDGTIVAQEGGIHGVSSAPVTTSTLGVGSHVVKLFYVDRNVTGAGLYFNVDSTDITVTNPPSVPEPASWAMMVCGFGLVGGALRRRRTAVRLT